ncbi:MAG: lytic transglycosylase domain-containing protein [Clostridiales bacterium]|nr:lytic transglycosylase domain-containing protein [Clostridiales bacterium]
MCMSFFNLKTREKLVRIIFKALLFYLVICWILFGVLFASRIIERRYFYPLSYKETIFEYADYYGLSRVLIFAVIKTESSFDKNAQSKKGAKGLMQITDKTANYIANKLGVDDYDIFNVDTNVNFGCFYIKYLYNRFKNMKTALVAYNAGEGNVALWLLNTELSDDGKTLKEIPFSESREYLNKIEQNFIKYRKLYTNILDKTKNIE